MNAPLDAVLFSAAVLGFRHGFDYDHIAAITDIAGLNARPAHTMRLGLLYALGHAATVAALGALVIGFQLALPHSMDRWAERLVGATLIVLAIYVLTTLIRRRGQVMPKSRAMLLLHSARWLRSRLRGRDAAGHVEDSVDLNAPTFFGVGIIHGLGAETPSQLALFLLAANLGGVRHGLLGLGVFLAGLLAMNTLMTASAAGLFSAGRSWRGWSPLLIGLTAIYSFAIGVVFLLGDADLLHNIAG